MSTLNVIKCYKTLQMSWAIQKWDRWYSAYWLSLICVDLHNLRNRYFEQLQNKCKRKLLLTGIQNKSKLYLYLFDYLRLRKNTHAHSHTQVMSIAFYLVFIIIIQNKTNKMYVLLCWNINVPGLLIHYHFLNYTLQSPPPPLV